MLNLDTSDKNDCFSFSPKNGIQVLECVYIEERQEFQSYVMNRYS